MYLSVMCHHTDPQTVGIANNADKIKELVSNPSKNQNMNNHKLPSI